MAVYNWYFSRLGNDTTGNGSISNPWNSLAKAKTQIDAVSSSDTANLFFKRGDTWTANTAAVSKIICYGIKIDFGNPVVNIGAYGYGNNPIFDGLVLNFATTPHSNSTTGPLFYNNFFEFKRNGCSISNIEIKRVYGHAIFLNPSNYFILDSCSIHDFGAGGISISSATGGNHITVVNNIFHTGQELWRYAKRSGWEAAIQLISKNYICEDNIIRYNVVYDIYGEGIQCPNSLCEYNIVGDTFSIAINNAPHNWDSKATTIRYNFVIASKLGSSVYPKSTGIRVMDENPGGSNANADINIYGNIVIGRGYGLRIVSPEDPGNPFGSVKIFNNTIIDSHNYNIYVAHPEEFNSVEIYNNSFILYNQTNATQALDYRNFLPNLNWKIDNNLFWTKGSPTIVDENWMKNAIIADPKLPSENTINLTGQTGPTYFKDIQFSDLYPLPGSALFGSGKPLGIGFDNIFLTKGSDFSTLPDNPKFNLTLQPETGNWDIGAIITTGLDLCAGVVCDNICIDNDLWSQKCVNGDCVLDQLVQPNSSTCGHDPCAGVVCDNICQGNDLWSQKCVNGACFLDQIIQQNSSTCGYDPCVGVVCDNICVGNDLWSQKCVNGACVLDQLVQPNSSTCGYDPCDGVVCDNICQGNDLWSQKCVNGACVLDQLVQPNSSTCGHDPCAGVVCDNICVGNDLWSQKCVNGDCVLDQIIQQNSVTCDLGPCENVFCHNTCVGNDLWSQVCDPETGVCKIDQLLQSNSATCMVTDYIPTDESTIKLYLVMGGLAFAGLGMVLLAKNK